MTIVATATTIATTERATEGRGGGDASTRISADRSLDVDALTFPGG